MRPDPHDPDLSDPNVVHRPLWRPSPEAFAAYSAREVELAKRNLRTLGSRRPNEATLHSMRTIQTALGAR